MSEEKMEVESGTKLIKLKYKKLNVTLGRRSRTNYSYDNLEMDVRSCFQNEISADHLVDIFYVVGGKRMRISGDRHLAPALLGDRPLILLVETLDTLKFSSSTMEYHNHSHSQSNSVMHELIPFLHTPARSRHRGSRRIHVHVRGNRR